MRNARACRRSHGALTQQAAPNPATRGLSWHHRCFNSTKRPNFTGKGEFCFGVDGISQLCGDRRASQERTSMGAAAATHKSTVQARGHRRMHHCAGYCLIYGYGACQFSPEIVCACHTWRSLFAPFWGPGPGLDHLHWAGTSGAICAWIHRLLRGHEQRSTASVW